MLPQETRKAREKTAAMVKQENTLDFDGFLNFPEI